MKTKREWRDNPELFEAIVEAIEPVVRTVALDEVNTYGDRGTIAIKTGDGRRFLLELHELT